MTSSSTEITPTNSTELALELKEKTESCWNSLKVKLDPTNCGYTPKKVARFALILIAICATCIVIAALMVKYPQASGAFFAVCGLGLSGSVILFIVALVKSRQKEVSTALETPLTTPIKKDPETEEK